MALALWHCLFFYLSTHVLHYKMSNYKTFTLPTANPVLSDAINKSVDMCRFYNLSTFPVPSWAMHVRMATYRKQYWSSDRYPPTNRRLPQSSGREKIQKLSVREMFFFSPLPHDLGIRKKFYFRLAINVWCRCRYCSKHLDNDTLLRLYIALWK